MIITGVLQLLCGALGMAKFVKLIPKTAFLGFFNGLAVVICKSQLETFQRPKILSAAEAAAAAQTAGNCPAVDFGFASAKEWRGLDEDSTWLMFLHVAIVMITMEALPKVPAINVPKIGAVKPSRVIPPALVGLLIVMAIEWGILRPSGVATPIVKDVSLIKGTLPPFHIPDVPWGKWKTWSLCLPTAVALCAIGLIESVLTLQAVDQILDQETSVAMKNQECLAQGLANALSGFFNAIGGDAMIGQSMINVFNGAKGRLSAATDAIFLMIYIVSLGGFIESVPTAGLAGILFIVVIHTFNWPSVAIVARGALPPYMCFTIILVTLLSILTNLAYGIIAGILWEATCYVWYAGLELDAETSLDDKQKVYRVSGDVYFANADDFNNLFTPTKDPETVIVHLANARLRDYSAIFTLNGLGKRYELAEKKLEIHMTEEDYDRYKAITDTENGSGASILRRLLPTSATTSIDKSVQCQALGVRKLRSFKIEEENTDLWAEKRQSSKPHRPSFVGFERTMSPGGTTLVRSTSKDSRTSKEAKDAKAKDPV
eukprot:TRINITY_DN26281_c0_g1_i3.p1 TRINITY_DN26281_c0_g1~~TRINITY_DN26281_c0_g1_i3.p1  ORF type:complete len:545 (+),score=130.16 TRINITY_DN26281_c0_g1_i3:137-1771(+)